MASRACHHQPIGLNQANSTSRLGEFEAKVVCCSESRRTWTFPQPPGPSPPPTRVATHGEQVVPFSRLLRHAVKHSGSILPSRGYSPVPPNPQGVTPTRGCDLIHSILQCGWSWYNNRASLGQWDDTLGAYDRPTGNAGVVHSSESSDSLKYCNWRYSIP